MAFSAIVVPASAVEALYSESCVPDSSGVPSVPVLDCVGIVGVHVPVSLFVCPKPSSPSFVSLVWEAFGFLRSIEGGDFEFWMDVVVFQANP